jgi:hypothetical protein
VKKSDDDKNELVQEEQKQIIENADKQFTYSYNNEYLLQGMVYGIIGLVFSIFGGSIAKRYDFYLMSMAQMSLFIILSIVKILNKGSQEDEIEWLDVTIAYSL